MRQIKKNEKKRIFKVLTSDMYAPVQYNMRYRMNENYHCIDFDSSIVNVCSYGFYGCTLESLHKYFAPVHRERLFLAEVWGRNVHYPDFQRWENIRIVKELKKPEILHLCKEIEEKYGYRLAEAYYPKNPLVGTPKKPTKKDIELLKKWIEIEEDNFAKIKECVEDTIRNQYPNLKQHIWDGIGQDIIEKIRLALRDEIVWAPEKLPREYAKYYYIDNSVKDFIYAYLGSLYPRVENWKKIQHKEGEYPFQCAVELLKRGFVPSFDGGCWRLHSGKRGQKLFEYGEIVWTEKKLEKDEDNCMSIEGIERVNFSQIFEALTGKKLGNYLSTNYIVRVMPHQSIHPDPHCDYVWGYCVNDEENFIEFHPKFNNKVYITKKIKKENNKKIMEYYVFHYKDKVFKYYGMFDESDPKYKDKMYALIKSICEQNNIK